MTQESIIGVYVATNTLEVGEIQSVKHVESTHSASYVDDTNWVGMWAGQATCVDQSDEKLHGSGAASTEQLEVCTMPGESTRQGDWAQARRENYVDVKCRIVFEHTSTTL